MIETAQIEMPRSEHSTTSKVLSTIAGVIMVIGGLGALANPFAASLAAEQLAGWTFLVAGGFQLLAAFQKGISMWMRALFVVLGLMGLLAGISLINHPLAGMIQLTTLIGVLFLVSGGARVVFAIGAKPARGWILWLVSGLITIIISVYLLGNIGGAAMVTLGVLLGIELVSAGFRLLLPSKA